MGIHLISPIIENYELIIENSKPVPLTGFSILNAQFAKKLIF